MIEARRRRFLAEINVIPLVDVVLVLLVIFMVTAPMLYRGMDITLPQSATNTIKPEQRVVLTVERDRRVYIDKDSVPLGLLQTRLDALRRKDPGASVVLRADQSVPPGPGGRGVDRGKKAGSA